MKPQKLFLTSITLLAALFMGGCATTQGTYVDSQGPNVLTAGNQITITDFYIASDELVNSLISSGALERSAKQPAVLAIDRIINDTREQFNTDLLVNKIEVALSQTGKVVVSNRGLGGRAESVIQDNLEAKERYLHGNDAVPDSTPDFTLTGTIIQSEKVKVGNQRQNTYTFQMSLHQVGHGVSAWKGEKTITKQYKKAGVSW